MDRRRIEILATEIGVRLLVAGVACAIVAMADAFLDWDLLDGWVEKLADFAMAALFLAAVAALALSYVLNVARLAAALERMAEPRDRP